jgi:hypothetical protein
MKRVFEIELDVPANFDATYNPPYVLGSGCVITNGVLAWNVYADAKTPEPQWRTATHNDEGKQARFRDTESCEWQHGKLLHWGPCDDTDRLPYCGLVIAEDGTVNVEWFGECEVQV